jgi:LysM repeat protein
MAKRVEDAIGGRLADFQRPTGTVAVDPAAPQPAAPAQQPAAPAQQPAARAQQPAQQQRAQQPARQQAAPRTYTIRSGDTLDRIARQHGTTVAALQRANPGLNPRRLIPGRTIQLP